jgi:hypothetical protein
MDRSMIHPRVYTNLDLPESEKHPPVRNLERTSASALWSLELAMSARTGRMPCALSSTLMRMALE